MYDEDHALTSECVLNGFSSQIYGACDDTETKVDDHLEFGTYCQLSDTKRPMPWMQGH